ncbi:hypothetical protein IU470_17700 [Nocardia abscessus]|uniref:Uncharacterized protein n=1 Tax=Nocardia abscessus TaxID=120957 RepID=A0ABS0CET8_9NOCA|nr:hypothetical protein [Nocardia abscessus]MBF6226933.1 hypothetical protein [Nocardia abscessus]
MTATPGSRPISRRRIAADREPPPRDPFAFALALWWDYQDSYPAGIPMLLRRAALGGPARVAARLGYRRRQL